MLEEDGSGPARFRPQASDALVDEVAVGSVTEARRQTDKCVEGGAGMAPSIPAKDELVEIPVEMRLTHTVEGAQAPALQIGKHPMDPGQHDVSRHAANHLALMRRGSRTTGVSGET